MLVLGQDAWVFSLHLQAFPQIASCAWRLTVESKERECWIFCWIVDEIACRMALHGQKVTFWAPFPSFSWVLTISLDAEGKWSKPTDEQEDSWLAVLRTLQIGLAWSYISYHFPSLGQSISWDPHSTTSNYQPWKREPCWRNRLTAPASGFYISMVL
jgi:hypothetical protein